MRIYIFWCSLILLCVTALAFSNSRSFQRGYSSIGNEDQNELTIELERAKETIVAVKNKISSMVEGKNDYETPYRLLVTQNEALKIKAEAAEILESNAKFGAYLIPLKEVVESCEDQETKWDKYCFKEHALVWCRADLECLDK